MIFDSLDGENSSFTIKGWKNYPWTVWVEFKDNPGYDRFMMRVKNIHKHYKQREVK